MNIDIDVIDIEKLRKDLIDYFTSAIFMVNPIAMMEVNEVENANTVEIVDIAIKNKFDLSKYIK